GDPEAASARVKDGRGVDEGCGVGEGARHGQFAPGRLDPHDTRIRGREEELAGGRRASERAEPRAVPRRRLGRSEDGAVTGEGDAAVDDRTPLLAGREEPGPARAEDARRIQQSAAADRETQAVVDAAALGVEGEMRLVGAGAVEADAELGAG